MLTPPPDENTSISMNDCNYIQFRGVNYFFENFGTGSCIFQNQWRQGTGDVKGVRSFHVTAAIGCFRMEPRFSRSRLIVAWGTPSKLAHSGHQSCSCKSYRELWKGNPDWHGFKREQKVESLLLNWQDGQDFFFHHTLWDQVTRAIGLCCCLPQFAGQIWTCQRFRFFLGLL